MAVRFRFTRDRAGIGEILKGQGPVGEGLKKLVDDAAQQVAKGVDDQHLTAEDPDNGEPAEITGSILSQVTDRYRATVTIRHDAGMAMQAKHGVLTKAAAAAGLEVKTKGGDK